MKEGFVINTSEVKTFVVDNKYSSKMLLDNTIAGEETVLISEGTLKGGKKMISGSHEKSEIYYVTKGEGILTLGEKEYVIKAGSLVFIPEGVFHSVDNKSKTEDLVLLALWMDASANEVYNDRIRSWGKSFKTIYE